MEIVLGALGLVVFGVLSYFFCKKPQPPAPPWNDGRWVTYDPANQGSEEEIRQRRNRLLP